MRHPSPPAASASWKAFVGRLNRADDRALAIATSTLPTWVLSIFSKYTRSPAVSTMAMAMFQLFLRASAMAGMAIFLAVSMLMFGP